MPGVPAVVLAPDRPGEQVAGRVHDRDEREHERRPRETRERRPEAEREEGQRGGGEPRSG